MHGQLGVVGPLPSRAKLLELELLSLSVDDGWWEAGGMSVGVLGLGSVMGEGVEGAVGAG